MGVVHSSQSWTALMVQGLEYESGIHRVLDSVLVVTNL